MSTRLPRALAAGTATLAVLLLAAGCGQSKGDAAGPSSSSPSTSRSASPSTSPSATAGASSTPTTSLSPSPSVPDVPRPALAPCRTDQVSFELTDAGGGAAGSVYDRLVMINKGTTACTVRGYGGVSYVDAKGRQVGAAAVRDPQHPPTLHTVQPGGDVVATLRETEAGNYPQGTCRPTKVAALRIYPPDETHAAQIAHPTTGCASTSVTLLTVGAYAPEG